MHREYPPECKALLVRAPVMPILVSQFRWLAKGVVELEIRLPQKPLDERSLHPDELIGMLPELLAIAASAGPNLRTLSILELRESTGAVLASCACLTQITKLSLGEVDFLESESGLGTSQIGCLSNLQALEVRGFSVITTHQQLTSQSFLIESHKPRFN